MSGPRRLFDVGCGQWVLDRLVEPRHPGCQVGTALPTGFDRVVRVLHPAGDGRTWVQVAGHDRVLAIADEDLERENEQKTSAVHFLRFELDPAMITALEAGAALGIGVDHPEYRAQIPAVGEATRKALVEDLA